MIKTKSVYDPPSKSDGRRVLVMTRWPRGVSKDKVDEWMKELGTPPELITKWKAGKVSWESFSSEYRKSLQGKEGLLRGLALQGRLGTVTLLCTEKDPAHCHRSLLKRAIDGLE